MKKILIRVESHSKSWIWWMETRIFEFCKFLKHDFTFLTNSRFLFENKFFWNKNIFSNYFSFYWILKDIFTFRNFEIIESNGLRDNIVSSLNFLIFFPFYKLKKIKFFLVIHGNSGILEIKWIRKFIYFSIFKIWLKISDKIIVVSEELKDFLVKNFKEKEKKIEIIVNFIEFKKDLISEKINFEKKAILVSRLDRDKIPWILESIDFCLKNNIFLDIYGNGENLEILRKKFEKNKNINFLWFKKQNEINYKEYFLIFAMWRALLEGISNNLIWILIGYEKIISEINLENYEKIKYSNFSGRLLESQKIFFKEIWKEKNEIYEKIKNDFDIKNLKDFYK